MEKEILKYTLKWKTNACEIDLRKRKVRKRKVFIVFKVTTRIPEDITTVLSELKIKEGKLVSWLHNIFVPG